MKRYRLYGGLAVGLLAALLASVRFGAAGLGWAEVVGGLTGSADPTTVTIVRDLRLPRALLGALVGAALALSGATFQALLRNPLAEPYVLGVAGGAALGAVAVIGTGWALAAPWMLPLGAMAGAFVTIAVVVRIARGAGPGLDVRALLLAGVVVGVFCNACLLLLLSLQRGEAFREAVFWLMGSLAGASWRAAGGLAVLVLPVGAILCVAARPLDLLAVGEESARHLGVRVARTRLLAYLAASFLTAVSVAVAGSIGFVGLFVPHAARLLWGGGHRRLLPAAALLGAAFLPLADTLARTVVAPAELPLGVITAFVGVPFFVAVMRRRLVGRPG
jgi:iron complex transport system permease protein